MTNKHSIKTSMWLCGPPPAHGQKQRYPSRFWFNFNKHYDLDGKKVLHMFSGSMNWGDTTDFREDSGAEIIAPYDQLPIKDNIYDWIIADPPYSCGFAKEWTIHPKELPKPKRILMEASRITKVGGHIAILHIIVIPAYKVANVERVALHGILCGPNNAIRVLNVFKKI